MARSLSFGLAAMLFIAGCGTATHKAPIREAVKPPKSTPQASPQSQPARPGFYRVQPGDTLYKIAFENGLDYQDLASWNGLVDPNLIRAGEELRLSPPQESVSTAPSPGPAAFVSRAPLAATPAKPTAVTAPAPSFLDSETPPENWVWPAKGEILTRFNDSGSSKGIDIANRRGTPVVATAPGRVVYAGAGLRGYGKLIIIKHSKSMLSAYGHQDDVYVKEGQMVSQNHLIGRMGDSDADRVKLHFEIREFGKPVDPMKYLPAIAGERWGSDGSG
jgi:lipoprotein NlpD